MERRGSRWSPSVCGAAEGTVRRLGEGRWGPRQVPGGIGPHGAGGAYEG